MAWSFEGTILPAGEPGRVVFGAGEVQPLPGRFALPGLVDAHCHLTVAFDQHGPYLDPSLAEPRLGELAASGVATIRDVGGDRAVTLPLTREAPRPGRPLVLAAGRFFAPAQRYFPRMYAPVAAEDLVTAVLAEIDAGARWIKLIADFPQVEGLRPVPGTSSPTYPPEVVAAVVDAAHAHGVRVAAHSNHPGVAELVAAGIDSIEHGEELDDDLVRALGRRGGAWTPTLGAIPEIAAPGRPLDAGQRRGRAGLAESLRYLLPLAIESGVTVLTGSDVVGSVWREVALLAELGLSPEQALAAASTRAQQYLECADDGSLVSYATDPRDDPWTLANPAAVVIRGVRVR